MMKQYIKFLSPLLSISRKETKKSNGIISSFLILFLLIGSNVSWGQISESFETGMPIAYTPTTSYSLGSGTWTGSANQVIRDGTLVNVKSGLYSCQLRSQTGAQITTPILNSGVGTVSVWASSTTSGSLQIRTSTDGVTFTQTGTTASFTSIQQFTFIVNDASIRYIQFYRTAGTVRIDDLAISIPVATPIITGSATATAFTTTYGTASSAQSFAVSGSNLTADLVATAPTGFEVSSDATSYGATATFIQSAGTASGTLRIRLAANANVGGSYNAQNIVLSSSPATSVNIITAASGNTVSTLALNITGLSVVDKNFDNTTTATLSGTPTLNGVLVADTSNVTLGGTPVADFDTSAVGNGKPVAVTGYTISGSASSNYSLTQPSLFGNILSTGLLNQTITFGALSNVTYGLAPFGLTATSDSSLPVSYSSSDENIATISGSTITIVGAGSFTITASQDGDSSYNPAASVDQTLTVDPKELTVSGATASNKIYDADTTTNITGGSLVGIINSDVVSFSGTGNFDDANVGNGKPVAGNLSLSGVDAGNYFLTQPTLSANITPKELQIVGISIANKQYDTTNSATILGSANLFGVEFADAFSVSLGGSPIATFYDASVSNNKPVTVSGYTFSGSTNYYLTQPSGLTANITLISLTITGLTADNKVYDRDTSTSLTGTASLYGVLAGDEANVTLSGSPSANFLTVTSGNSKTVSVTGYSLSGSALANYTLGALNLQANITKKDVTISGASVADKDYDGTSTATLSGTLSGVISPDSVILNKIANFDDANVGTNKTVTSSSSITGADSSNYNLVQPTGLTASIAAIPCTLGNTGVVTWNFATASPSSNTASGVTISDVLQGNNNGTTTMITSVSTSSGYTGSSGTNNAGAAARTGVLDTSNSAYFEFTLTPTSNITLTGVSFGSRGTGTGPKAYSLESSVDNFTNSSTLATGTLNANSSWALYTLSLSNVTATSLPVKYRLYGHSGTGSPSTNTANWRIDDLQLTIALPPSTALSSPAIADACSGANFAYTPTTTYSGSTITWTRAAVVGISNTAVTTPQATNPNEILVNTTNAPVAVIYSFVVTGTTCYVTQDVTVTVNPAPIVTASNVSGCAGTAIALSGTPLGGTFSVANPYTGADTTYTYTYTDGNGCTAITSVATIMNLAQPLWYLDADSDGYYVGTGIASCTSPGAGYTTTVLGGNDCNDTPVTGATIYPGAPELCYNGILENCNGTLSQGCAAVVVNMNPSYNNFYLTSIANSAPAVPYTYAPYTNLKYRFRITNTTTGVTAPDVIQSSPYVQIPGVIRAYNCRYSITASAVINEEVIDFAGNTIVIFSPTVQPITLTSVSCGSTLVRLNSTIIAKAGLNATSYTFRIRLDGSTEYAYSPSATQYLSANSFVGFPLQYSSTYQVAVQYTFNDPVTGLPVDSGYGPECLLYTGGIPVVGLASPICGTRATRMGATMSANSGPYATSYRFRIRLFSDNSPTPQYNYTAVNASSYSQLSSFVGITLAYNTAYSISVEYSVFNGTTTVWSGFGPECKVTTPLFPVTSLVASQCGLSTATSLTQTLNITPYPGATSYKVKLDQVEGVGENTSITATQEIEISTSTFKLSDFSIAQLGKNYNVSVKIKLNGVFGDYDTACDLFTVGAPIARTIKPEFKATAYPNPFANNFMIDVKTSSESVVSLKVYDMVGRLIEQREVRVLDLETTTIGERYPSGVYNVVVSQEDSVQTVRVVKR